MSESIRELRKGRFEEEYLWRLKEKFDIYEQGPKYIIDGTKFGTLDFYPKANRLLVRKDNAWFDSGMKWMEENLLK